MKQKSIKFNFLMNLLLTASTIIFPLISFPYVSRILKPTGTGSVAFANSIVIYFSMFAQLGIPTYGIREVAKYRDSKEKLSQLVGEIMSINLITCFFSYILYFVLVFSSSKLRLDYPLYIIMGVNIVLNSVGMEWLYKGLEQYQYITIRSLVFKVLALVLTFLFINSEKDIYIYGGLTIFAAAGSNIFNLLHIHKYIDFRIQRSKETRKHLKAILIFFFMSVATTVYTNLDNVMLGFMAGNFEVGLYNAAIKVKTVLVVLVTSLGTVLLPRESYYVSIGAYDKFYEYIHKAIHFTVLIAIPMLLYFVVFSGEVILVLSGQEYELATPIVVILMPTLFFIGISNIIGIQMLVPLKREKHVLISVVVGAIIDFLINLILIPMYGGRGAAIGTVIAEFVVLIIQCFLNRKEIKENSIFSLKKDIYIYIGAMLAVSISYWFVATINMPIFRIIISCGITCFVYSIFLLICKDDVIYQVMKLVKEGNRSE